MEWWLQVCVIQVVYLTTGSCTPLCTHYLNRRREGVFHYDRHTRYQLTYTEAQHACLQDFGAQLATRDQLEQAMLSGLEECRAGWITSAEVAYPRIHSRWNCGFNRTGIVSYGIRQNLYEKWDAFCYKNNDDCSHYNRIYFGLSPETKETSTINPTSNPIPPNILFNSTADPPANPKLSPADHNNSPLWEMITPETGKQVILKSNDRHFEKNSTLYGNVPYYEDTNVTVPMISNHSNESNMNNRKSMYENEPSSVVVNTTYIPRTEVPLNPLEQNTSEIPQTLRTEISNNTRTSTTPSEDPGEELETYTIGTNGKEDDNSLLSYDGSYDGLMNDTKIFEPTNTPVSNTSVVSQINTISISRDSSDINPKTKTNMPITTQEIYKDQSDLIYLNSTPVLPNTVHELDSEVSESPLMISLQSISLQTIDKMAEKTLSTTHSGSFQLNLEPEDGILEATATASVLSTNRPYVYTPTILDLAQSIDKGQKLTDTEGFTIQPTTVNNLRLEEKAQSMSNSEEKGILDTTPAPASDEGYTVEASGNRRLVSSKEHLRSNDTNETYSNDTLTANETISEDAVVTVIEQQTSTPVPYTYNHHVTTEFSRKTLDLMIQGASDTPVNFTISTQPLGAATPTLVNMKKGSMDACGGLLKEPSGQFQSPGFPQSYEKEMNCTWVIEVPPGYYIILEFVSIVLEAHRNCEYDYVLVYDGNTSDNRVLGRFCGSQLPHQLRSTSNIMTVIMRSDSTVEFDGFSLRYTTIQSTSGIRLVEGKNSLEGAVEIEYPGLRGNICPKLWRNKEAQVVCRQLGYKGPAIATRFIREDKLSWAISFVNCSGSEAILENCIVKNSNMCGTTERAGVICEVYESCAALKNAGVQQSGSYMLDPDGVDQGEDPFPVECDMVSDPQTGITIIGHNTESKERVTPCKERGCYSRIITYKAASLAQLTALTSVSEHCEQFVKLDCRHIKFLDGSWGWWVSRHGDAIASWGGAETDSGRCSCGENGDCAFGIPSCNCDANDDIWRTDEGAITDKSHLPIKEIAFGGIGDMPVSMAFYRIGKLRCWGTISEPPILESCAALKEAGITESGRYVIDPDGVDKGLPEFEVFCDMSSHSGITVVGHDSERRMSVSPCEQNGCYKREVSYSADLAQLNALTKVSKSCEQFVRLDCHHVPFMQSGWWESWKGERKDYWGGADPATGGCACGKTGSCALPENLCNCDSNDHLWRTDDGFLRDKTALPIKAVYFGDTDDYPYEMAYHTIGKLRCRGKGR